MRIGTRKQTAPSTKNIGAGVDWVDNGQKVDRQTKARFAEL